jgi:GNAT superfamily N-acetyltransferase
MGELEITFRRTMNITIDIVKTGRDRCDFVNLPYRLHKGQKGWVPPLVSEVKGALSTVKNPFYQHASIEQFVARRDGKVVGRIAAVVDQNFIKAQGQEIGLFGFFECSDDQEVAGALFERAAQSLKERKMQKMLGPSNPSMNDEIGVLIDAFDIPPAVKMVWNPAYYPKLFENAGFSKAMDIFAYDMHEDEATDRLKRMGLAILKRSKISIRKVNMKRFDEEVETVRQVYNSAWSDNWGFVPWTKEEFEHAAKGLKQIIDPDLLLIAEDQGKPVAFSLGLPDMNLALKHINGRLFPFGLPILLYHARRINRIRIPILGVVKEYRGRGIDTALYYETFRIGTGKGYHSCEMSWILEDNELMNRAAEMMGARKYKTYRLYDKPL